MRDEADREAERLLDLGRMLVSPGAIRRGVLEHEAGMRARLQLAPGARDPGLAVDDDVRRIDRVAQRDECEQSRSCIAAGVRDERSFRWEELGQRVAPPPRPRVVEAVPLRIQRRVEPVRSRQVDDDDARRRLERGRPLVAEAEEEDVGAGAGRIVVSDEGRQRAVQANVERVIRDCSNHFVSAAQSRKAAESSA